MPRIHPTSVVSPLAELGSGVEVGPFCVIEDAVIIGDDCKIDTRAEIKSGVILGKGNSVGSGAVIGALPQHTNCPKVVGGIILGDNNVIRENVTIHRAMYEEANTILGDGNLLMVNSHVGHDCVVGSNCIVANNGMLGGHVVVQDRAYLSGAVGVHQYCRIGTLAMVGGQAHITKDVPPFVMVDGLTSKIVGLNSIGMRRAQLGSHAISEIKQAYRIAYRSGLTWDESIRSLMSEFQSGEARDFAEFLSATERGCLPERHAKRTTLKIQSAPAGASQDDSASTKAA